MRFANADGTAVAAADEFKNYDKTISGRRESTVAAGRGGKSFDRIKLPIPDPIFRAVMKERRQGPGGGTGKRPFYRGSHDELVLYRVYIRGSIAFR